MRTVAAILPLLVAAAGGCSRQNLQAPVLTGIEPALGSAVTATPVRILGRFQPVVRGHFDDKQRARVDATFTATLGDRPLEGVQLIAGGELRAIVPAGLSPGPHDLLVNDPGGRSGRLAAAFTVVAPDAGPPADSAPPDVAADLPPADVAADLPPPDVTPPDFAADLAPDQQVGCPSACGNDCDRGICELDCSGGNCACPPGLVCDVTCPPGGCTGDIDCGKATACNVVCPAGGCKGNIDCGSSDCVVTCADGACKGNISCAQSASCTVRCTDGACKGNVACAGDCKVICSNGSCLGNVSCGSGPCSISCSDSSCQQDVDCAAACACSTSCSNGSCGGTQSCPSGCEQTGACVTTPATCDTC